jgi:hypothetical protein
MAGQLSRTAIALINPVVGVRASDCTSSARPQRRHLAPHCQRLSPADACPQRISSERKPKFSLGSPCAFGKAASVFGRDGGSRYKQGRLNCWPVRRDSPNYVSGCAALPMVIDSPPSFGCRAINLRLRFGFWPLYSPFCVSGPRTILFAGESP